MKFRNTQDDSGDMSEINISPMIDMVFILLIFFIVTTVFVEEPGVDIDKPPAVTDRDLAKNSILIAVTPGGEIVYGGSAVTLPQIRTKIRQLLDSADMPVIIQADEQAPAGTVVKVVDQARLAQAQRIHISTERN